MLDEPTAHLDAMTAGDVLNQVLESWAGRPRVMSTHRLDDLGCFDEVVALS